jgi:orotidine-5'-phosphate decarboxylase
MMFTQEKIRQSIRLKKSFLCVGLDPDPVRMPPHLSGTIEGIRRFLIDMITATADYAVAYKPNYAFFEALGPEGLQLLTEVRRAIPDTHFVIGDAKRGDIGNTAAMYARAAFDVMDCHAVTLSPYMGLDTLQPFLKREGRWAVVLVLTSNPGSADFQRQKLVDGTPLWEHVLHACVAADVHHRMMFVVGATHPTDFQRVRELAPNHFLLVPGFGAQQGSLKEVARHGLNQHVGLLANVSRAILYASQGHDYATAAERVAQTYQQEMAILLDTYS